MIKNFKAAIQAFKNPDLVLARQEINHTIEEFLTCGNKNKINTTGSFLFDGDLYVLGVTLPSIQVDCVLKVNEVKLSEHLNSAR